jgi:chromosome segregation ATPase
MSATSVQRAHDALLEAKPDGASHDGCPLCQADAGTSHSAEEAANVADAKAENANVYTEAQHFALLESAVERETSSLTEVKSTLEAQVASLTTEKETAEAGLAEAKAQLDKLEAEKANVDAALETKTKEFDDFKAELARTEQVAALKSERVAAVKAANANLADTYFTDERAQRWAEMSAESFEALVADMGEAASATKTTESAETDATEQARESAAFTGGTETKTADVSNFAEFMKARRQSVAASS